MAKEKILLVDADQKSIRLLEVSLRKAGFSVTISEDGTDALKKVEISPPDLIISDILMPVMDGFTLCRAWMEDERLKTIPFVFYTATYTDPKDEDFALDLGAVRFIVKPLEPDKFLAVLQEIIATHEVGKLVAPRQPMEDIGYYKEYNAALVRKLEDKLLQLEETNRALEFDIAERKRIEAQLKASLEEKQVLLKELYHRTKNNMQVISSILALQAADIEDEHIASLFRETQDRIQSMALAHQKLYQSHDLSKINLKEYLHDLVMLVMDSHKSLSHRVSLSVDMEDVFVLIDIAIPCGQVLNELISNVLKHAFRDGRDGKLSIRLHRVGQDGIELSVGDNGVGVPEGFDFKRKGRLGLQTVFGIVEHQLRGKVMFETDGGVACQISFEDTLYSRRV
jgi:two-component sensor histidine kinase/CheY-like chemotaxis protein